MQDYTKDLTLAFAGTGATQFNNLDALLGDFIFGPVPEPGEEEIEREVTILIPVQYRNAPGVQVLRQWGEPMGMVFDFVKGDDPHDSLDQVFLALERAKDHGQETAFIMFYNPDSKYEKDNPVLTDLEVIGEAKNFPWLVTLDLCEGLVDYFEGYESTDDRIKREALEEAFAEQQKAKEAAEKAAKPARKTAAKKATAPRKRAASKPTEVEDKPLPIEPEKPLSQPLCDCGGQTLLQVHVPKGEGTCHDPEPKKLDKGPHVHRYVWGDDENGHSGSFCSCGEEEPEKVLAGLDRLVDDAVKREAKKKAARTTELSGTIVASAPKLPEALSPVTTADVWQDVAKAVPADVESFQVSKADIVELGEAMEEMANAFGKAIRVYKNIVEGK